MPLTERDPNTRRDPFRRQKRLPSHPEAARTYSSDENSRIPQLAVPKATLPSQHLRAPTKASAAKTANSPLSTGRRTPQSQSVPPLRTPTPTTLPATITWNSRTIDRAVSAEKAAKSSQNLSQQKAEPVKSRQQSEIDNDPQQVRVKSATRRSLSVSAEKPLPPRPVASFINMPSPSKDSRGLIDASEMPLTISVGGQQHDWPALTPSSASTSPTTTPNTWDLENISGAKQFEQTTASTASSMTAPGAEMTSSKHSSGPLNTGDTVDSERSPSFTLIGAALAFRGHDRLGHEKDPAHTACKEPTPNKERTHSSAPRASLRHRISNGNVVAPFSGSKDKTIGFTDFSKPGSVMPDDSRPHSPSPASFSRPRPTSVSHLRMSSTSTSTGSPITSKSVKAQKTASRIPIPDSKKATLVEVKNRRSSGTYTSKIENGPTFGSRRLDAPDTLKILDQGIRRRQVKRVNTNESTTSATSHSTNIDNEMDGVHHRYRSSSPEVTTATSSSEDEEIATPTNTSDDFIGNQLQITQPLGQSTSSYDIGSFKLFDGAVLALGKTPPPSNSPYTGPLQTIPSQAALPFHESDGESLTSTSIIQATEFPNFAKRLSELQSAHANYVKRSGADHDLAPVETRNSLIELLEEYEREDRRLSRNGLSALDDEARKHVTRALLLLEGKGSPPQTDVDNETLLHMFGHLKRGLERAPKTVSFVENAAVAQRYLAEVEEKQSDKVLAPRSEAVHSSATITPGAKARNVSLAKTQAVASKWSDSTPSDIGISPASEGVSASNTRNMPAQRYPSILPPKQLTMDEPCSVGYPSRIPNKPDLSSNEADEEPADPPSPVRRNSSPMLGKRKPGSIRTARDAMNQEKGGFARTTASAESRKTFKNSTTQSKQLNTSNEGQRGRISSVGKAKSKPDGMAALQTPRAHSKSRYMLEKINGLFSGKRERKPSAAPPPIPTIEERHPHENRDAQTEARDSPVVTPPRAPPLTKMPTLYSPGHTAYDSNSVVTTPGSDVTPMESVVGASGGRCIRNLLEYLSKRAQHENSPSKKERLLVFTEALRESLICAREAQISAETARSAARSAQLSYELTQKSMEVLQRLAASMVGGSARR